MSNKKDANTLHEIAAALSIWRDAGPDGPKKSEDVRKEAVKAMKLLRDNADLLHRCENAYKVNNRKAKMSLDKLYWMLDSTDNQDPEFITKRIGYYDYKDFAQDHLIDELNRWANEVEQETGQVRKGGQGETDDIAIDDKELTILVELAEVKDKTYSQVEIEAATNIPRGTIKDKLPRLEKIGLVHRPLGKRKGYQITDKGREIAKRNQ